MQLACSAARVENVEWVVGVNIDAVVASGGIGDGLGPVEVTEAEVGWIENIRPLYRRRPLFEFSNRIQMQFLLPAV